MISFKKYIQEANNLKDACWDGYEAIGMKMKNGKKVPNCVPVKSVKEESKKECKCGGNCSCGDKLAEEWSDSKYKNPNGGLTKAGVMAYRREHPGSKLKTAVRTPPSKLKPGSEKAKRRLSFCRRMKGMKAKLTSAKTARDPDSRINKALRAWNC